MSIWFRPFTLEEIQQYSRGSMTEHLDLRFTEIGPDFLRATMPVDHRTVQPFGLLHGGASVTLAETLGSVAATHCVDMSRYYCVGIEINANHVRSARSGRVTGTARPILRAVGQETVIFEAPRRMQQAWLLQHAGPNVNLGNIQAEDVIALETLRRGLRFETLDLLPSAVRP